MTDTTVLVSTSPPSRRVSRRKISTPAFASVTDWCALSGVGRSKTYELLGEGKLRAVKNGSSTLIDVQHGLDYLDNLPPAEVRPHGASRAKQAA